jgi:membrane fusion protein (multidrug efflux system)
MCRPGWRAPQRHRRAGVGLRRQAQRAGRQPRTPGTSLLSIVPLDQLWVDANFKESELRDIRVGQPANRSRYVRQQGDLHGKVVGLSAGTGSAFSLLPAQNASGNWIKVVQRVPVRISLDPKELARIRCGWACRPRSIGRHQQPVYTTQALAQPLQQAGSAADAIIAHNL